MTALDFTPRPAPRWLAWLACSAGVVVAMIQNSGAVGAVRELQADPVYTGQMHRLVAAALLFSSCMNDPSPPRAGKAEGESCSWTATEGVTEGSQTDADACAEGLVCNTSHGLTNDWGYCAPACKNDADCESGFCDQGACGWRCAATSDCPGYPEVLGSFECWQDVCVCQGCP